MERQSPKAAPVRPPVLRDFAGDAFVYHGLSLAVLFRSHPSEVYLLVDSETAMVGRSVGQTISGSHPIPIVTPVGGCVLNIGTETKNTLTYTHAGKIIVTVSPMPSN